MDDRVRLKLKSVWYAVYTFSCVKLGSITPSTILQHRLIFSQLLMKPYKTVQTPSSSRMLVSMSYLSKRIKRKLTFTVLNL